jgi:hypothetical protein
VTTPRLAELTTAYLETTIGRAIAMTAIARAAERELLTT